MVRSSTSEPTSGSSTTAAPLRPELADVGRLWRRALRTVVAKARAATPPTVAEVLARHLGPDSGHLPVLEERWAGYDHVNLQVGVDAWLAAAGRTAELVGVGDSVRPDTGLAALLGAGGDDYQPRIGSVARVSVASGPGGATRSCVRIGIYLVADGPHRTAMLLRGPIAEFGRPFATLELVTTNPDCGARIGGEIRELALQHNVFRGQVLGFGGEIFGPESMLLSFHERPRLPAAELILRPDALAAIERQVVQISRFGARLAAAGQHLKRGLLLYGPPGVGKTHTIRYLMSSMTDTTVVVLAGNALHLIAEACSVARALQPAMVVIEDVDLIAEERGRFPGGHPLLFQLLNEMDGLAEDADVVFVLTTNRADLLEPALASRPGRVDQAVELTLPDLAARRALFELYRGRLRIEGDGVDDVLVRCEGVTASFVKELLRRAAIAAADRPGEADNPLTVSVRQLHAALDELLDQENSLTRVLLGGEQRDWLTHSNDRGENSGWSAFPGVAPSAWGGGGA